MTGPLPPEATPPLAGSDDGATGDRADAALGGNASRAIIVGALARGGTHVVSMAALLVAFAFVTRDLGKVGFGQLSVAVAIAAIAQGIGDTAVSSIAQRLLVEAPARSRAALQAELIGTRLLVMPPVLVAALLFGVLAGYDGALLSAVALVGLASLLSSLAAALVAPLAVELRAARASVTDLVRQIVLAAGLLGGALLSVSIVGYAAVYPIAAALSLVAGVLLVEPQWRRIARPSRETLRRVASEASWLALAVTLNSLFLKLLTVLAELTTTASQVGLFSAAARITEVAAVLSLIMASVAYPLLSRAALDGDDARFANAVQRVVTGMLLLIGPAVVVLAVAAGPLIGLFTGREFAGAADVLPIQALALLGAATTQALIWALLAKGAQRLLVVTNLTGLLTIVVAGLLLIGPFGARGAAWAAVVGEAVLLCATVIALRRAAGAAAPSPWPAARIGVLTLSCTGLGLLLPLGGILSAAIAVAVFGAAALALRMVPPELLDPARRILGRGR